MKRRAIYPLYLFAVECTTKQSHHISTTKYFHLASFHPSSICVLLNLFVCARTQVIVRARTIDEFTEQGKVHSHNAAESMNGNKKQTREEKEIDTMVDK